MSQRRLSAARAEALWLQRVGIAKLHSLVAAVSGLECHITDELAVAITLISWGSRALFCRRLRISIGQTRADFNAQAAGKAVVKTAS